MNEKFSTEDEIIRVLDHSGNEGSGTALYNEDGWQHTYKGEAHQLTVGETGCGKSRGLIIPQVIQLSQAGELILCLDPKGEIYRHTKKYLKENKYECLLLDFRNVRKSSGYNPLMYPYKLYHSDDPEEQEKGLQLIDELAHSLYPKDPKDPFWSMSAMSVFDGIANALIKVGKEDEINLQSVYSIITKGDDRFGANKVLAEFAKMFPDTTIENLLTSYVTTANDTRAGIRSTFLEGLGIFCKTEGVVSLFSRNDIDISKMSDDKPLAIFVILPQETPIFDSVASIVISQITSRFEMIAKERPEQRLKRRLNVILEELGNIGESLPQLPNILAAGRSSGIRCTLVLQTLSQLETIYGKSKADTIIGNCGVTVAFRTNHFQTLSELSKLCGTRMVERGNSHREEPLVSEAQLASMDVRQALVLVKGGLKYITRFPDFTEIYGDTIDDMIQDSCPITEFKKPKVFDIKAYVTEHNKKAENELPKFPLPFPRGFRNPFEPSEGFVVSTKTEEPKDIKQMYREEALSMVKDSDKCITVMGYGNDPVRVKMILSKVEEFEKKFSFMESGKVPRLFELDSEEKAKKLAKFIKKSGGKVFIGLLTDASFEKLATSDYKADSGKKEVCHKEKPESGTKQVSSDQESDPEFEYYVAQAKEYCEALQDEEIPIPPNFDEET